MYTKQRASTAMHTQRRSASKSKTRVRSDSPATSIDDDKPDVVIQQSMDQTAVRNVYDLIQKFDKWEMSELLTTRDAHWLLSNGDIYKVGAFTFFFYSNSINFI